MTRSRKTSFHPQQSNDKTPDPSFRLGALTPYEALVAGGDKKKEILLRRSKGTIDKIMADVVREMLQQKLASLHYEAVSTYMLFLPTMVVTLLSAALSILGTSDIVTSNAVKTQLTICVALLQLFLSVLQSLSKQLDYGAKAGLHRSAARALQKIHGNAKHAEYESRYQSMFKALKENKRLSIGYNILDDIPEMGDSSSSDSDSDSSHSDNDDESKIKAPNKNELTKTASGRPIPAPSAQEEKRKKRDKSDKKISKSDSLGKQYRQATEQLESIVPVRIANAFNMLEYRIRILNESLMSNKTNSLVAWEQVLPALYFQLSETIIEWPGWPIFIPKPSQTVEKTLAQFKELLKTDEENNADLLMDILDRSNDISNVQKRLAKRIETRHRNESLSLTQQLRSAMKELEQEVTFESDSYASERDPLVTRSSNANLV